MDTKTILIHTVNIMVLTHIDAVTIVIGVTTPNEIVPPEILITGIIVSKESKAAKDCRREV